MLVGLSCLSTAYADMADWTGEFLVDNNNQTLSIGHTPQGVNLNHMLYAGVCLHLSKGASINDITFNQNIDICTQSNVGTLTNEVSKIGQIVSNNVTLGPNYTNN